MLIFRLLGHLDGLQDAYAAVHASPYTPNKKATPSGIKRDQVRWLLCKTYMRTCQQPSSSSACIQPNCHAQHTVV